MIIAEIGQNYHNLDEARELTRLAKDNGADLVKAQLFDSIKLYGKEVPAYLSFEQAKELFDYGASIGIEVFYSVFDVERVKWCEEIGVKRYKIAYNYRFDIPLRAAVFDTRKPSIVSGIDLLCVPKYPAKLGDYNLDLLDTYFFQGISDHTVGLELAKKAIERGAKIIEKHFCFRHDYGNDAPWGMTPEELEELVIYARNEE